MKKIIFVLLFLACGYSKAEIALGVNVHGAAGDSLKPLEYMGATWLRFSYDWRSTEVAKGEYNWEYTDYMLRDAKQRGFKILYILAYPPDFWSSTGGSNGVPDKGAWMRYVDAITKRYADWVDVWEVWNEPNLDIFFKGTAKQYIDIVLKPASPIIRENAPNSKIAAPGLAHLGDMIKWLKELKRYNALDTFDIVSHHLYSRSRPADFKRMMLKSSWGSPSVLKAMQEAGLTDKDFWLTEYGCDQNETHSEGANANCLFNMTKILMEIGWVKGLFIYALQDAGWALINEDLSPKASVARVRTLFKQPPLR